MLCYCIWALVELGGPSYFLALSVPLALSFLSWSVFLSRYVHSPVLVVVFVVLDLATASLLDLSSTQYPEVAAPACFHAVAQMGLRELHCKEVP